MGVILVFVGALICALLGFLGSAIGMRGIGKAATGVISERPELAGKMIVLQALLGSQGIYGLVGAFLLLNFSGILGATELPSIDTMTGILFLIAGLPIGISGLFTAMFQGAVASSAVLMVSKNESSLGSGIILVAMIETWAIFGILLSFIFLTSIGS